MSSDNREASGGWRWEARRILRTPKPHFTTFGGGERKVRASDHSGGPSPAYTATTSIVKHFKVTAEKSMGGRNS